MALFPIPSCKRICSIGPWRDLWSQVDVSLNSALLSSLVTVETFANSPHLTYQYHLLVLPVLLMSPTQACVKWPQNGTCWMAFSPALTSVLGWDPWLSSLSSIYHQHGLNASVWTLWTWSRGQSLSMACMMQHSLTTSACPIFQYALGMTQHSWDTNILMSIHPFALYAHHAFCELQFPSTPPTLWRPASNAPAKALFSPILIPHENELFLQPCTQNPLYTPFIILLTKWYNYWWT